MSERMTGEQPAAPKTDEAALTPAEPSPAPSAEPGSRTWGRRLRRWALGLSVAALAGLSLLLGLVFFIPLPERLTLGDSVVVTYADGTPCHVFLSPDEKWRIRVLLEEVDPAYLEALIRLEDKRFYQHLGVDPLALGRATVQNLRRGEVVSGASTLTMQLVRLLEPRPRHLGSKAIEAFRALQLELRLDKRQILENYLRFIPYGRNIEGLSAASWGYFGHSPQVLTPAEIATLLAVPQGPSTRAPSAKNRERLRLARDDIAARLLALDALTPTGRRLTPEEAMERVRASEVPVHFKPFPRAAPHLARWLKDRNAGQDRLPTFLDPGLQRLTERLMSRSRPALEARGVYNGVAVLVEHATGQVKGLVGNFDFDDLAHGGQIPGFDVPRSPGSALKPFLYALAIDRAIALPGFLVPDTPVRYGAYTPSNYDGTFQGLVRFEDALSRSLNIPFVRVLKQLGLEPFLGTLRTLGFDHLDPTPGHYGLSAAIGGLEVTPLELAGAYAALAENGLYRPVRLTPDQPYGRPLPVFSPGAAWLTRQALSRRDRPDFPRRRALGAPVSIHWKTGTSYGHRDAWAIGSDARFTAAIWLGNFNNLQSAALVGADAAGPLLFDLLEGVSGAAPDVDDPRPDDLIAIDVCAYSGYPKGPACPSTRKAWAPRNHVPSAVDPFHVTLEVDLATGLAVTPECRGTRQTERRTFVVWPASVRRWIGDEHRGMPEPPAFAPDCQPPSRQRGPRILSPPPEQVLVLIPGVETHRQRVPLEAESQSAGDQLSWFVDGAFVGQAAAHERAWWEPKRGRHEILVTDSAGRSARRWFTVQ